MTGLLQWTAMARGYRYRDVDIVVVAVAVDGDTGALPWMGVTVATDVSKVETAVKVYRTRIPFPYTNGQTRSYMSMPST